MSSNSKKLTVPIELTESIDTLKIKYSRENNGKLKLSILMVIHFLEGVPVTEISKFLMISRDQVYYWIRRYKAGSLGGLTDKPKSGRPTRIDYTLLK